MKGRSFKLREAHKTGGAPSACSVLWSHDGCHVTTSCAADTAVLIHDLEPPPPPATRAGMGAPAVLRHHKDGVTAIAIGPGSGPLASGSIDHSVKMYSFPDGDFQSNITRFTLPIRSLAFNRSGSLLAAAGDDDGIKLISTVDSTISKVLKGHRGSITGLSFDPKNEHLASIDSFGTVIYWELSTGKPIHTLKSIAPNFNSDQSVLNMLSWRPDGEMLAVPGLRNDVVMYDRDTGEKLFSLKGDHEKVIYGLSWSPNGKYLATTGLDKQILIWDVELKQDIERQKFEERICGLDWKPIGNSLAVIDVMGKFGIWENPVPINMKSPTEGVPTLKEKYKSGFDLFDEEELKPSNSGSLQDTIDESNGEFTPVSHKRSRKKGSLFDERESYGEEEEEEDLLHEIESRKRSERESKRSDERAKREKVSLPRERGVKMQEAFQPGSTPAQQSGKRRFLCFNLLGCVTTLENDGYSHVEVELHDTGRGPRVPAMTDYFGFTMASLNEFGSVFANPCKGDNKGLSTLMYCPFSSWDNKSEWSMRFEGEEVRAVALGKGWVAAVTNLNHLRIFTEGGLQKYILSVNGPVVTVAGFGDQLAIVTHASDSLSSGDQVLEIKVFNIMEQTKTLEGRLPLTPSSHLTWFGFSEQGQLSSYDSKGVLRVFSDQFGGSWLPVFSATKARKSEDENYWVVGLNANKLFCIICKSPDSYPSVMPKPVLTILDLAFPLASSDLGADELENELIMKNIHLSQIQKKIEEMEACGKDITALDDESFNTEAAIDRCILKLIASCCNGDKLVRATELARLLISEKSVRGALKLVKALKIPILQEKFSTILQERKLTASNIESRCQTPNSFEQPIRVSPSIETPKNHTKMETKIEIKKVQTEEPLIKTPQPSNPFAKGKVKRERENETGSTVTGVAANGGDYDSTGGNSGKQGEIRIPVNPFAKRRV